MRIARLIGLVYIGTLIVITSFQTRIIFPGQETQGQDYAQVRPRPGTELVHLKSRRGEPIVALYGPALTPEGRPDLDAAGHPTLIYFYGNAMCLNDASGQFERFRRLGLNVIIPDYLGYGMSGGSASEKGCRATSDAVYDYLVESRGIKPSRIVAAAGHWAGPWPSTWRRASRSRASSCSPPSRAGSTWVVDSCRSSPSPSCCDTGSTACTRSDRSNARSSSVTGAATGSSRSTWGNDWPPRRRAR